ncbi:ethanolamine utilization protein [Escherichia coli]|uniref:Ethanolamine utilization protein n=1 Tax=Escherichia coli TaxID=562 RepID=A0A376WV09_ECOLX|nr:ethanolamine utilization protein [Escherichia coli]
MKLAVALDKLFVPYAITDWAHDKLLMVEMIDPQGNPDGQCAVAIDNMAREPGVGVTGEWQFRPPGA